MKRKIILFRSYVSMLFYDTMQMMANPLLSKPNKSNWQKLRKDSKEFYDLIEKMMS